MQSDRAKDWGSCHRHNFNQSAGANRPLIAHSQYGSEVAESGLPNDDANTNEGGKYLVKESLR